METTYEVHLENFEGPLDLLLFLIKKNDLDIYSIPISSITEEYLAALDKMQAMNLEVAGDFLVMAATLMQIKARSLLPAPQEEEESGPDPRAELVQRLLEYQKFKGAAHALEERGEAFKNVFYRGAPVFRDEEKSLDLSLYDLLEAVREALVAADQPTKILEGEEFPIEEKIEKILFLLEQHPHVTLREIFSDERKRAGILACFLALLELIKLNKIIARQAELFGEIRLFKKNPPAPTAQEGEGQPVPPVQGQEKSPASPEAPEGASPTDRPPFHGGD